MYYNVYQIEMTDMYYGIIDGTNIDTSIFHYSNPKAHSSGGKVVNLYNKNTRESLIITTPLILTWGAQEVLEQGTKKPTGKYTMSLQFPSPEFDNEDLQNFLSSIKMLEEKIKQDALLRSKEWFGKVINSREVIDEKFNVMLRYPKKEKGSLELDYSRPPTLSVKIPCWDGLWKTEIYDEDGEPLFIQGKQRDSSTPLDYLKSKTHVICLLQCGGLWFVNGKISITWNLKQAIVQKPKQNIIEGTCLLITKTNDRNKLKTLPPPEDIDPDGPTIVNAFENNTFVEDDENITSEYYKQNQTNVDYTTKTEINCELDKQENIPVNQEDNLVDNLVDNSVVTDKKKVIKKKKIVK